MSSHFFYQSSLKTLRTIGIQTEALFARHEMALKAHLFDLPAKIQLIELTEKYVSSPGYEEGGERWTMYHFVQPFVRNLVERWPFRIPHSTSSVRELTNIPNSST